ncbi:NADPH:quinone reductase [Nonomuraea sp. WAC 01424]|uniref:zinc-binding dehydrogenase n=1 Tax=Nonomuraea sp. WAC 01424 TaxID=2203200 RepID=UPI000F77A88F|nr:zinc-binding dehydrogenase [Nonomuraea sp. WAC 01424]RSN03734.1 NADPH:quinone reductase [Nonomuraea sp. WAC 01424]
MRVVRVARFGGPEVLETRTGPDPVAGPGEVVVRTGYAEINFIETQLRQGFTPGPPLPELPYVPGGGVGGHVVSVGEGADSGLVGRRVVARTPGFGGGNAELVVVRAEDLVEVPDGVELADATALLNDGSTAVGLFANAGIRPGERVLVEAAAGGLGSLLVQLAHGAGARVIGAAGSPAKLEVAAGLGAEVTVDYSRPGWTREVLDATGGRGPDVVFDGVGGELGREAFGVTARGGRFSVHGASSGSVTAVDPEEAARRDVTVIGLEQLMAMSEIKGANERTARALAEAADEGLRAVVGRTYPLERAGEAHAAIEAREVSGKTLLTI